MSRGVELHATFKAGGHSGEPGEQHALVEEPVRLLLQKASADVLVLAAGQYDWDISKRWTFATTFRDMQQLAKDWARTAGFAMLSAAMCRSLQNSLLSWPKACCNAALPLLKF